MWGENRLANYSSRHILLGSSIIHFTCPTKNYGAKAQFFSILNTLTKVRGNG
jgi:hypothetical protein